MTPGRPESPALDALVDDILSGQRVVLFPPGVFAFAGAAVTFIVGASLLCAMTLPVALESIIHPAVAPLLGIAGAAVMLALAAFAVASGRAQARAVFAGMVAIWLALACLFLLGILGDEWAGKSTLATLPIGFLAAALATTGSSRFRTFTQFKFKIRERRRQMLQPR